MAKIICTVTNCYYNNRLGCSAPAITVDGNSADESRKTCCETFIEQKPGVRSSVSEPKSNTDIKCEAVKCVFNKSGICQSADIVVNGKNAQVSEETCCSTFKS